METLKAKIVPWDDPAFHAAYEQARKTVQAEGLPLDSPMAAMRLQVLLRSAGYPYAVVSETRSVDEALAHVFHWLVRRDGEE